MTGIKRIANGKGLQIKVEAACDGMRLELYLRKELQLTGAQVKSMKFRENGMTVNGKRVRVSHILKAGELLELLLEDVSASSSHLVQVQEPLHILYEDDDLIAVWKEAGLVVHPSHGHYGDTLSNRVYAYFANQNMAVTIRSIGRLDRDTGGIVVFAKNQVAAARLWEQKEKGIFWKEYLAVCEGMTDSGFLKACEKTVCADSEGWYTINAPIAPLPGDLMRMCVSDKGKQAVTHFQIIGPEAEHTAPERNTLIRVRIDTGRTHQIRVHMASIGYPLVGDELYGRGKQRKYGQIRSANMHEGIQSADIPEDKEDAADSDMYLCAWKTQLIQPFTGKTIRLAAENLDRKMQKAVSYQKEIQEKKGLHQNRSMKKQSGEKNMAEAEQKMVCRR